MGATAALFFLQTRLREGEELTNRLCLHDLAVGRLYVAPFHFLRQADDFFSSGDSFRLRSSLHGDTLGSSTGKVKPPAQQLKTG